MSELEFGSSQNCKFCCTCTVPSQESIIADSLAAWEHEEFAPENITNATLVKEETSTSKGKKRKPRQSILLNNSFLLEIGENSINYSNAIQSSALQPKVDYVNHISESIFSSAESADVSCTSESQIKTDGEIDPPLVSSTKSAKKKNAPNNTLPSLPQEGTQKQLNVPPKEVIKKKATKSKSKGTQVNVKTKNPKNVDPKKTTVKKVIRNKLQVNKKEKQENNEHIEESIVPENVLNANEGKQSNIKIKSKAPLVKEKVELLNMPSTSHEIPHINNTIGTATGRPDLDETESESLVPQSGSIEIIKETNTASKINIKPAETNLFISKKKAATAKPKKNLPSNKVKTDSLTVGSNKPKQGTRKIKEGKPSPKSLSQTSKSQQVKIKHENEDTKDKKRHLKKSEIPKPGNKKQGKVSPAPKTKRQNISCGCRSSDSSSESDDSSVEHRCCSCTSYSESSYDSPPRRRCHR